jgi:hypothetical protein
MDISFIASRYRLWAQSASPFPNPQPFTFTFAHFQGHFDSFEARRIVLAVAQATLNSAEFDPLNNVGFLAVKVLTKAPLLRSAVMCVVRSLALLGVAFSPPPPSWPFTARRGHRGRCGVGATPGCCAVPDTAHGGCGDVGWSNGGDLGLKR